MTAPQMDWESSLNSIWLPSRAFLLSWLQQTVPARRAAIEEAIELHKEIEQEDDPRLTDMAVLGVVGESMQPLEDLAYLGTAWDSPFTGVAQYVRATTYTGFTAQTFWQEARKKWDDERIEVFAGLAMRDPNTREVHRTYAVPGLEVDWTDAQHQLFDRAAAATVAKVRRLLGGLFSDWIQLAPYFHAYKHGGLAINRLDVVFVDDDMDALDASMKRHEPSIAVWTRGGRKQELAADFNLSANEVVEFASSAGGIALDMIEVFVSMRLWVFDSLVLSDEGTILGWKDVQIPFTDWLTERDLVAEDWQLLGRGPRLTMAPE